jgi:uncharacterized membrane protein YtjA (UPF0391 family)
MVMVLPFVIALLAAAFAWTGRRGAALGLALSTIVVQVWWLAYHATDSLNIGL